MRFLLASLTLAVTQAFAANTFVAPHIAGGRDTNDCLSAATPCESLQRGIDAAGIQGTVKLAEGRYTTTGDISHYGKFIDILGNCDNHASVVVEVPSGRTGFSVQDHATGGFWCFTCVGGQGSACIMSRQYAIVDYGNMRFGAFPGGTHVAAVDDGRTNCSGTVEIFGQAVVHANASGKSSINMPCTLRLTGMPSINYFYVATGLSLVTAYTTIYQGNSVGQQFVVQDSTLHMNVSHIPGTVPGILLNGGKAY